MLYIAIILGIIEGLTEFIPVSSTGHLILFGDILGFQGPPGKVFEIVIQLGAIFAICWLYRKKLTNTSIGFIKRNPNDIRFIAGILIAFTPAMLLGVLLHGYIKEVLFNPTNVSIALIIGGFIIILVEKIKPEAKFNEVEKFSLPLYFKIGLCQCIALIPGTSRSGATIIGAMMLGVDRRAAAEFSFFLAIPTMFAATVYDLYKNWSMLNFDDAQLIAAGFISAFLSAMLVVKIFVAYIKKHGFLPFAYYRIILGATMLYFLN
jgi:undecaprenyl-diphosphatase